MNPIILGGLISGGASLLGGIGNLLGANKDRKAQKEFAKYGVRWRVEDAKAAGIHPLAALGMQGMQYSPVYSGIGSSLSEAGQNVGRAVAAQMTAPEREAQLLGLQALRSQIGESDARRELALSEAARNLQEMNAVKTFPVETDDWFLRNFGASADAARSTEGTVLPESVVRSGYIVSKPPTVYEQTSGDSSTAAGNTPFWRTFQLRPDMQIRLPGGMSGDPSEALESVSESAVLMAMVMEENVNAYGPQWVAKFRRYQGQGSEKDPIWRRPGAWLGGKLADLRDRAGARSYEERAGNYRYSGGGR